MLPPPIKKSVLDNTPPPAQEEISDDDDDDVIDEDEEQEDEGEIDPYAGMSEYEADRARERDRRKAEKIAEEEARVRREEERARLKKENHLADLTKTWKLIAFGPERPIPPVSDQTTDEDPAAAAAVSSDEFNLMVTVKNDDGTETEQRISRYDTKVAMQLVQELQALITIPKELPKIEAKSAGLARFLESDRDKDLAVTREECKVKEAKLLEVNGISTVMDILKFFNDAKSAPGLEQKTRLTVMSKCVHFFSLLVHSSPWSTGGSVPDYVPTKNLSDIHQVCRALSSKPEEWSSLCWDIVAASRRIMDLVFLYNPPPHTVTYMSDSTKQFSSSLLSAFATINERVESSEVELNNENFVIGLKLYYFLHMPLNVMVEKSSDKPNMEVTKLKEMLKYDENKREVEKRQKKRADAQRIEELGGGTSEKSGPQAKLSVVVSENKSKVPKKKVGVGKSLKKAAGMINAVSAISGMSLASKSNVISWEDENPWAPFKPEPAMDCIGYIDLVLEPQYAITSELRSTYRPGAYLKPMVKSKEVSATQLAFSVDLLGPLVGMLDRTMVILHQCLLMPPPEPEPELTKKMSKKGSKIRLPSIMSKKAMSTNNLSTIGEDSKVPTGGFGFVEIKEESPRADADLRDDMDDDDAVAELVENEDNMLEGNSKGDAGGEALEIEDVQPDKSPTGAEESEVNADEKLEDSEYDSDEDDEAREAREYFKQQQREAEEFKKQQEKEEKRKAELRKMEEEVALKRAQQAAKRKRASESKQLGPELTSSLVPQLPQNGREVLKELQERCSAIDVDVCSREDIEEIYQEGKDFVDRLRDILEKPMAVVHEQIALVVKKTSEMKNKAACRGLFRSVIWLMGWIGGIGDLQKGIVRAFDSFDSKVMDALGLPTIYFKNVLESITAKFAAPVLELLISFVDLESFDIGLFDEWKLFLAKNVYFNNIGEYVQGMSHGDATYVSANIENLVERFNLYARMSSQSPEAVKLVELTVTLGNSLRLLKLNFPEHKKSVYEGAHIKNRYGNTKFELRHHRPISPRNVSPYLVGLDHEREWIVIAVSERTSDMNGTITKCMDTGRPVRQVELLSMNEYLKNEPDRGKARWVAADVWEEANELLKDVLPDIMQISAEGKKDWSIVFTGFGYAGSIAGMLSMMFKEWKFPKRPTSAADITIKSPYSFDQIQKATKEMQIEAVLFGATPFLDRTLSLAMHHMVTNYVYDIDLFPRLWHKNVGAIIGTARKVPLSYLAQAAKKSPVNIFRDSQSLLKLKPVQHALYRWAHRRDQSNWTGFMYDRYMDDDDYEAMNPPYNKPLKLAKPTPWFVIDKMMCVVVKKIIRGTMDKVDKKTFADFANTNYKPAAMTQKQKEKIEMGGLRRKSSAVVPEDLRTTYYADDEYGVPQLHTTAKHCTLVCPGRQVQMTRSEREVSNTKENIAIWNDKETFVTLHEVGLDHIKSIVFDITCISSHDIMHYASALSKWKATAQQPEDRFKITTAFIEKTIEDRTAKRKDKNYESEKFVFDKSTLNEKKGLQDMETGIKINEGEAGAEEHAVWSKKEEQKNYYEELKKLSAKPYHITLPDTVLSRPLEAGDIMFPVKDPEWFLHLDHKYILVFALINLLLPGIGPFLCLFADHINGSIKATCISDICSVVFVILSYALMPKPAIPFLQPIFAIDMVLRWVWVWWKGHVRKQHFSPIYRRLTTMHDVMYNEYLSTVLTEVTRSLEGPTEDAAVVRRKSSVVGESDSD